MHRDKTGGTAHGRRRRGRLTAGVARADNHDVIRVGGHLGRYYNLCHVSDITRHDFQAGAGRTWERPFETNSRPLSVLIPAVLLLAVAASAQITSPKQEFGFDVGDDYQLINYTKSVAYWKKLDGQSDRMSVVDIGKTSEGRTMIMAIITSPRNLRKLARYKQIAAACPGQGPDRRRRPQASPPKARPSSGSTAACTPPKSSARST